MELGWLCVVIASGPLTESQGFTDAFVRAMPWPLWNEPGAVLVALVKGPGGQADPRLASAVILVGGLVVTTAGYLGGLAALNRGQNVAATAWVSGLGIVFHVTLWLMPGLLSGDIISYALYGRLGGVYGLNPYVSPPSAVAADPFVAWLGGGPDRASLYGPLWTDLSAGLARLAAEVDPLVHVLIYKFLGSIVVLVSMVLLWRLLPLFGSHGAKRSVGILLFAWNPLVLLELVGSGHNDGFMLMLVLGGLLALASPGRRLVCAPLAALLLFTLAALVKYVPAILVVLTAAAWVPSLPGWRTRIATLAGVCALTAGVTIALSAQWFDRQHPLQMLSNAGSAGDRYVNAIWDLPTSYIARRWIDRNGENLAGADESVRVWPRTILRGLLMAYVGLEVVRLRSRSREGVRDVHATSVVEAATRIFLVALLVVANQVLAWYFAWPLAIAASLGWRNSLAKLAVAYSVLYLPLFYAIHEDLVRETAPWLLAYALAPLIWLFVLGMSRQIQAHQPQG
jgi:hypothetical protein